ncbi:DUF4824 domain-containing protein [Pseudomonas sp. HMWF032]|uniref:DUF4824 family protein n=1 Tax=unclassified Pseudomonas TaxID=196821 RepID=UPI000D39F705|nr:MULTISPECIES: DUF4824 family protein [unclassified Pseudomonas]PTS83972.1 DUF4824 domain-containing protein [Pseudomonas sp. HMWF032]PTT85327.1 DUF4824 domain-containing protein [Pseudomonas sp. HMWF010]WAC43996.1 DUF4824 family protein [Pseudomonas sp. SL4(2022)]
MSHLRYLVAGLALIGLVNAVALLGAAWNREEPAESSLQLSERELGNTYAYWRKDNSSLTLRLDYRWPSRDSEHDYLSISAEKMAELGFALPGELNDESVRRYRRQLDRDALLVLELDGPAYQREVALAQAAYAEALRLAKSVPDSQELREAADYAGKALEQEQQRASRLLVVDVGLDQQVLRARYPDRQRYAIVRAIVEAQASSVVTQWTGEGDDPRPQAQRWVWQFGGSADTPGLQSLNLPRRWHATFANLKEYDVQTEAGHAKRFSAELAFGRRLEPWFVELAAR